MEAMSQRSYLLAETLLACGLLAGAGCHDTPAVPAARAVSPAARAPAEDPPAAPSVAAAPRPKPVPPPALPPTVQPAAQQQEDFPAPASPAIDPQRVQDQGIRRLEGKHLTLYTDLREDPAVDELCQAFDQAYPQWCDYFDLPHETDPAWRLTGCLMQDEARFRAAGLWDEALPDFPYGFCLHDTFWVREQESPYYRRHLLLHEAAHGFMYTRLGGVGPTWYMEGMAEYFGTHRWQDGKLQTGYMPRHREETPDWGRIKLIQEAFEQGRALSLPRVLPLPPAPERPAETYAWCWGAAHFLSNHPRYAERFRQLSRFAATADFSTRLIDALGEDWNRACEEWQLFVGLAEYGYDLERMAIDYRPAEPLPAEGAEAEVAADRGWQASGFRLDGGRTYRLQAAGRFQLTAEPTPWQSEAEGVSIRYYRGRPLGRLLAAVLPAEANSAVATPLLSPLDIGLQAEIAPSFSGTLYLRINDSPAELADNAGTLAVRIEPATMP